MKKLRIGIVGAGARGIFNFGVLFTREYGARAEVVALADPNRVRAEAGREFLRIDADIDADPLSVLSRKDVDAVVITSPDYLHEEHCLAAFKRGKHVFVDKPLAVTGDGCLRVLAAARRAKGVLYMGFNLRHDVVVSRLKTMAAAGTFGDIISVQAVEHYDGGRTYMARWNRLKTYSGGLFIHKGTHDFDIVNWLMAPARPARVSCFASASVFRKDRLPFALRAGAKPGPTCTRCPYRETCPDRLSPADQTRDWAAPDRDAWMKMWTGAAAEADGYERDLCLYLSDKDAHDQGIAMIEYDTGATAQHSEYFATSLTNRRYMLEGTLGHADADLHGNTIECRPRWSGDVATHKLARPKGGHGGADTVMCAEFLDCVQKGRQPRATGADGAWSVAVGQAAELARAERRVVPIAEVLDVKSPLLKPA